MKSLQHSNNTPTPASHKRKQIVDHNKENIDPSNFRQSQLSLPLDPIKQQVQAPVVAWITQAYSVWPYPSSMVIQTPTPCIQAPGKLHLFNVSVMFTYAIPAETNYTMVYQPLGNTTENTEPEKPAENDEKYKTELCKNWVQYGKCSYGNKCRFAHGSNDLINKQIYNPKYKSKKCEGFHVQHFCPYGSRCNFIHDDGEDYRNRKYFYSYLLDVQTRLCLIKSRITNYIKNSFGLRVNHFSSGNMPSILRGLVRYILNDCFFKRLSTFKGLPKDQEILPSEKNFVEERRKVVLDEIMIKLEKDYDFCYESKEYWDAISLFIEILLAVHPDLTDCEQYGLNERKSDYLKLLIKLYSFLIVEPGKNLCANDYEDDDDCCLEEINSRDIFDFEDTMEEEDEEIEFCEADTWRIN